MKNVFEIFILFLTISVCINYIIEYFTFNEILYTKNETEELELEDNNKESKQNTIIEMTIIQNDYMFSEKKFTIDIELYDHIAPNTCKNFKELCKHNKYSDCPFHRVINNFIIQGGDITNHDGTGGTSIYGEYFADENFELKHDQPGLISMANSGVNTNNSQFFFTLNHTPELDGKHVVFGKIIKGYNDIKDLSTISVDFNDTPISTVKILHTKIKNN